MDGRRVSTQSLGLESLSLQRGPFLHEKSKCVPKVLGAPETHPLPNFVLHLQLSRPKNDIVCAFPRCLYTEIPDSRHKRGPLSIPFRLAESDNLSLDGCGTWMARSILSYGCWLFVSSTLREKYCGYLWPTYMLPSSVFAGGNKAELSPPCRTWLAI